MRHCRVVPRRQGNPNQRVKPHPTPTPTRTPSLRWNKNNRVVVKTIASRRAASLERSSHVLSSYASNRGGSSLAGGQEESEKRQGEYDYIVGVIKSIRMTKQYDLSTFVLLRRLQLWPSMARWRAFERLNARRGLSRRPRRCRRRYRCRHRRAGR